MTPRSRFSEAGMVVRAERALCPDHPAFREGMLLTVQRSPREASVSGCSMAAGEGPVRVSNSTANAVDLFP